MKEKFGKFREVICLAMLGLLPFSTIQISATAGTPHPIGSIQEQPFNNKAREIYKALVYGNILEAKKLLGKIRVEETWELYPVYELAGCYLTVKGTAEDYAPWRGYRTLLRIDARGEKLAEADAFLNAYGLSLAAIKTMIEECLYEEVCQENTIEGYDDFIRNIQNAHLKDQADERRQELAYQALLANPYAENCQSFLERHPHGRFAAEITELRDSLIYVSLSDNAESLEDYAKQYPQSKYAGEARRRAEQFNLPVFTASQARQLAASMYPRYRILAAYPYSNRERGNEQVIAVVDGTEQQGPFLILAHYRGVNSIQCLPFTESMDKRLDCHTIDKVEKVFIGQRPFIFYQYRNFTYNRECPNRVERVFGLYDPDNLITYTSIHAGDDSYAPDGTLQTIRGEWHPREINTYTEWLTVYGNRILESLTR